MACTGHTNSCPAHPGYDPPVSPISWVDPGLGTDIEVKGYHHFYYLNYYINQEFSRRSVSPPGNWAYGQKYTDDIIYADDYKMLRDGIVECKAWTPTWASNTYLAAGEDILDESTNEMRTQMDVLRAECLCNCNYACTCDCNYCTCNCNYACTCNCNYACTCDCNYCTCNCNYSCTCNCNYSDRRLKTNIKYL